jgi:hypothetical protein
MLDALACGEPPFDPDQPVPMRRASRTILSTVTGATYPAPLTAVASDVQPSSGASDATAPLYKQRPGRGHVQGA